MGVYVYTPKNYTNKVDGKVMALLSFAYKPYYCSIMLDDSVEKFEKRQLKKGETAAHNLNKKKVRYLVRGDKFETGCPVYAILPDYEVRDAYGDNVENEKQGLEHIGFLLAEPGCPKTVVEKDPLEEQIAKTRIAL